MLGFEDGSGISWTTCKQSAHRSRQITIPTPHHSIFTGRMLFLTPNEQCQSTHARTHARTHAYTHTHPFNGSFSGTTQVSRYQKGKPIWILLKQETVSGSGISWAICKSAPCSKQTPYQHPTTQFFTGRMDFTEAGDSEWQWHQLGHMQVCTLLQTDTMPTPHHSVFYRPDALPAA